MQKIISILMAFAIITGALIGALVLPAAAEEDLGGQVILIDGYFCCPQGHQLCPLYEINTVDYCETCYPNGQVMGTDENGNDIWLGTLNFPIKNCDCGTINYAYNESCTECGAEIMDAATKEIYMAGYNAGLNEIEIVLSESQFYELGHQAAYNSAYYEAFKQGYFEAMGGETEDFPVTPETGDGTDDSTGDSSEGGYTEEDLQAEFQRGWDQALESIRETHEQEVDEAYWAGWAEAYKEITNADYNKGFEDGIKEGDRAGFIRGYDEGMQAGILKMQQQYDAQFAGVFSYCTVNATIYNQNVEVAIAEDIPLNRFLGGTMLYSAKTSIENKTGLDLYSEADSIELNFIFDKPFEWDKFPISISKLNGSNITGVILCRPESGLGENIAYTITATGSNEVTNFVVDSTNERIIYPMIVYQMTIKLPDPYTTLQNIALYSETEIYNRGYSNGFNDGMKITGDENYDTAYETGKSDGYLEGKAEGFQLAKNADWTSLMTAVVEAPVHALQGMFHFEILGLDMRQAIGALLTLCVILIIIKKVVL